MKIFIKCFAICLSSLLTVRIAGAANLVSPSDGATVDPDAAELVWSAGVSPAPGGVPDEEAKVFISLLAAPNSHDVRLYVRSSASGGIFSHTFSSLRPNSAYQWKVDGLNNVPGADGNPGTPRTFFTGPVNSQKPVLIYPSPTPMPDPTPRDPDERVNLTPVSGTSSAINNVLTWRTGSLPANSYNVYFGTHLDKGGPEIVGNFYSASGTCSFSPGNLQPNTRYFWKVDLVDSDSGTVIQEGRMWDFWTGEEPPAGYAEPDTVLFSDAFENTPTSSNPALETDVPYLGWKRQDSSVQTRNSGVVGPRCVKLGGATSFWNSVSTEGMKTIRLKFRRQTSANQSLKVEFSVNGVNWRASGTVAPGKSFSEAEETFTVADNFAANQPNLIFRFSTSNTAATEYAYIDHVQVLGRAARFPLVEHTSGTTTIGGGVKSVIFLGDSLTNHTGSLENHWTSVINNRFSLNLDVTNEEQDSAGNPITPVRHDNLGKGGSIATKYVGLDPGADLSTLPAIVAGDAQSSGGLERLRVELKYRQDNGQPMPKFVIINFGTNDHKLYAVPAHEGEPVVDPAPAKGSDAVFKDNLTVIVKLVKSVGAKPVLVIPHDFFEGPVPGGNVNTAPANDYLDSYYSSFPPRLFGNLPYYGTQKYVTPSGDGGALIRFHKFTNRIREVAGAEGADLIDVNKKALEYDAVDFTIGNGVHLSDIGHRIYAETIGNYLEDRYGK